MRKITLDRLPMLAAMMLVVFIVPACTIRLRDDEDQASSATMFDRTSDPLATKPAKCRSVTYEQKAALSKCRKARAETGRQLLRQTSPTKSESGTSRDASPLFVPPGDNSEPRLGPHNSIPQSGKE